MLISSVPVLKPPVIVIIVVVVIPSLVFLSFVLFHQMICNRRRRRHCYPFSFVSFCIVYRHHHLHPLLCHHHPCIFVSASSCISDLPRPLYRRHRPWICSLRHHH